MTDRVETWIVDRFEGDRAVLERALHETLALPRTLLPADLREGDAVRVVVRTGGGATTLSFSRDEAETRRRAAEARGLRDDLKGRDPGGDIRL